MTVSRKAYFRVLSPVWLLPAALVLAAPIALSAQETALPGQETPPAANAAPPATDSSSTVKDATGVPGKLESADAQGADLSVAEAMSLATVVQKLTGDNRKQLGEMLANDWKDRPEWSDMLISLLKDEEMRPGGGWWKSSEKKYDWGWLLAK